MLTSIMHLFKGLVMANQSLCRAIRNERGGGISKFQAVSQGGKQNAVRPFKQRSRDGVCSFLRV